MKRIRRKLRWFTFIVVVSAGVNSYFNTSIAEQGGINATGLGGAFATAFFVFITMLIFISIPFNVLAFIAVRSNRYTLEDFQKVSRVLTWFIAIVALLFGISSYFAGFTAGSEKIVGIGASIYAVIFVPVILSIVVAVPTHVIAFIVFAIHGPRNSVVPIPPKKGNLNRDREPAKVQPPAPGDGDHYPAGWTKEEQKIYQQQKKRPVPLEVQALLKAQNADQFKERLSRIGHAGNAFLYGSSIALALAAEYGLPDDETQKEVEEWSKIASAFSKGMEEGTVAFDKWYLNKQNDERIPTPARMALEIWHRSWNEQQKENS